MSEQDPERWSALERPETDELEQAAANPGMSYGDPTETAMSDEPVGGGDPPAEGRES